MESARALIQQAERLVVLTGAGISAESGVPTFRGPGGYWRNRHFMELANPDTFAREPAVVWEWYCERRKTCAEVKPNAAHEALVALHARRPLTLITQNVDGLHERAGSTTLRLHGSLWHNRCTACGKEREDTTVDFSKPPISPCCGAGERPAIVWFGEMLPSDVVAAAERAVATTDVILVIGTSGVVYPAAGFIAAAKAHGAKVINVNPGETPIDADIYLAEKACDAIPALL
jgi:NAD-dependent deacetylase